MIIQEERKITRITKLKCMRNARSMVTANDVIRYMSYRLHFKISNALGAAGCMSQTDYV